TFKNAHKETISCLVKLNLLCFATASRDKNIEIWNWRTKECKTLTGHKNAITVLVLLNKSTLASCSDDGSIKFWNWVEGIYFKTLIEGSLWFTAMIALNEDTLVASDDEY